jgi:hypothetical protein
MIIKSPFKDYYDNCVGYGIDKAVVFERETEYALVRNCRRGRSNLDDAVLDIAATCSALLDNMVELHSGYFSPFVVGFCGHLYVGLKSYVNNDQRLNLQRVNAMRVLLNDADRRCVLPHYQWVEKDFTADEMVMDWGSRSYFSLGRRSNAKTLTEWAERNAVLLDVERQDLFFKHNLVSFVYERHISYRGVGVTINPILNDFNFQRRMDGITAFQEVSMHVASLKSANIRQPEPITDEMRAMSKGFDKSSFRKGPSRTGRANPKG